MGANWLFIYFSPSQCTKNLKSLISKLSSNWYPCFWEEEEVRIQTFGSLLLRVEEPAMTYGLIVISPCLHNFSSILGTKIPSRKSRVFRSSSSPGFISIRAVQDNEGPRRLIDVIRFIPDLSRNYFKSPSRRTLFGGISLLGGFYVAQTISLSFGALGVNDVIAAVLCVLLTEYVTRFYYSRPKVTFPLALLNNFKMGFTYGLFIDAFKLASWIGITLQNCYFNSYLLLYWHGVSVAFFSQTTNSLGSQ